LPHHEPVRLNPELRSREKQTKRFADDEDEWAEF
jgi:hypothetical protein